jgi:hypothetical protein
MAVPTPHSSRTDDVTCVRLVHRPSAGAARDTATCGRPYSFWSFSYRAWRFS